MKNKYLISNNLLSTFRCLKVITKILVNINHSVLDGTSVLNQVLCIKIMYFYGTSSRNKTDSFMLPRAEVPSIKHSSNTNSPITKFSILQLFMFHRQLHVGGKQEAHWEMYKQHACMHSVLFNCSTNHKPSRKSAFGIKCVSFLFNSCSKHVSF